MKKIILFLIFIPLLTHAQDKKSIHDYWSLDFACGTRAFHQGFYNQFNTVDNIKLEHPLQLAGISETVYVTMTSDWPGQISYLRVISQPITIQDTIQAKITGGIFSFPNFGFDLAQKSNWFRFVVSIGFNTGQLKIYGNDLVRQRNPFFSPKITIAPQVKIGRLALSMRTDYEYDISSPRWKRPWFGPKNKIYIDHLRQSGFTFLVSLGILIH